MVRIKLYQFYGFGQFPKAVVFDKIDIVGNTIHPFYRYLNCELFFSFSRNRKFETARSCRSSVCSG